MPTNVLSDKFNPHNAHYGIKYVDKKGKEQKLDGDNALGFGFTYQDKTYTFQFVEAEEPYTFMGFTYRGDFLNLLSDGKCKLYEKTVEKNTSTGVIYEHEFLLWKDRYNFHLTDSRLLKIRIVGNGKSLEELFSDCPDLVTRIQNKEFKKGDDKWLRLVQYYNTNCAE